MRGYQHERGFTIIELMIIVVIIGIMMVMALPSVTRMGRATADKQLIVEAARIWGAAQLHRADNKGVFPSNGTIRNATSPAGRPYVKAWPKNPEDGSDLQLQSIGGAGPPPATGTPLTVGYGTACNPPGPLGIAAAGGYCAQIVVYNQDGNAVYQRGAGNTATEPLG